MKKVLSLVIILVLIPVLAQANDASMGRKGETVYPMEETDVRMVSEDIYVKYNAWEQSHVKCEFVFENNGEAKTVLMGFPAEEKIYDESMTTVDNVRLNNFTANRNGSAIEVNEIAGADLEGDFAKYPGWYVFEVYFEAGETLIMTHEYDIVFTGYSTGHIEVGYILETGSTWNGTIGHTRVTFDLADMNPWGINMHSYPELSTLSYKNGLLVFEKYDYIPDFNLNVEVYFNAIDGFQGTIWPEIQEDFDESKAFFDFSKDIGAKDLIQAYNDLSFEEKFIETVYLNTIFGVSEKPYAPIVVKIEKSGSRNLLFYVKDRNFDMDDNAILTINSTNNNVIYTGQLYKSNKYSEYGTTIYGFHALEEKVKEAMVNNMISSYVVTVADEKGNESKTVFAADDFDNSRTTIISGVPDDGSEGYEIVNPPTSESASNESLALAFVLLGTVLFIFNRKNK